MSNPCRLVFDESLSNAVRIIDEIPCCVACGYAVSDHRQPNPIESEGAANRISNPAILKSGSKIEYGKPEVELPDLDDLRSEVRDHIEEVWGVDTRSQVEAAMLEQETDWVLSLIDKARIEERKQFIEDDKNGRNAVYIAKQKQLHFHDHQFDFESYICSCGLTRLDLLSLDKLSLAQLSQKEGTQ